MNRKKKLSRFFCYSALALGLISTPFVLDTFFGKSLLQFSEEFCEKTSQKEWVRYTSSEGDFTANFPGKPTVEEKQIAIPQAKKPVDYLEVKSDHSDLVSYSVSTLEFPKKWTFFGANPVLKGVFNVIYDSLPSDTKIVSRQTMKHKGHPALNFHIRQKDTETKGRLIVVGNKLFKVEFTQPLDVESEETGLAFIDSFTPTT